MTDIPDDLQGLSRRELQSLCKQYGIKANSKTVVLIGELEKLQLEQQHQQKDGESDMAESVHDSPAATIDMDVDAAETAAEDDQLNSSAVVDLHAERQIASPTTEKGCDTQEETSIMATPPRPSSRRQWRDSPVVKRLAPLAAATTSSAKAAAFNEEMRAQAIKQAEASKPKPSTMSITAKFDRIHAKQRSKLEGIASHLERREARATKLLGGHSGASKSSKSKLKRLGGSSHQSRPLKPLNNEAAEAGVKKNKSFRVKSGTTAAYRNVCSEQTPAQIAAAKRKEALERQKKRLAYKAPKPTPSKAAKATATC